MGRITDLAKRDIARITGDVNGFGIEITLTTPDLSQSVTVVGLHSKHHWVFNFDTGRPENSKNVHMNVSEQYLIDAGYPVRKADKHDIASLENHRVTVKDSRGVAINYIVQQSFPDETIGLIVLVLGDKV